MTEYFEIYGDGINLDADCPSCEQSVLVSLFETLGDTFADKERFMRKDNAEEVLELASDFRKLADRCDEWFKMWEKRGFEKEGG